MSKKTRKLALGTAQFGMSYGIANKKGKVEKEEITSILELAKEYEIDTLDTAKAYGKSEEYIGNYLKEHPNSSFKIITKLGDSNTNVLKQIKDSAKKLHSKPNVILAHSVEFYFDKKFCVMFK